MRKSKLMNWVVKPAMDHGFGHYSTGLTITEFYEKKFVFKKVVNLPDYMDMTTSEDFQAYYTTNYDGTPYPQTNYYPWFSPLIILALDSDGNFWTFDSFWNNLINWTDWDGTPLPADNYNAIHTFITESWFNYGNP